MKGRRYRGIPSASGRVTGQQEGWVRFCGKIVLGGHIRVFGDRGSALEQHWLDQDLTRALSGTTGRFIMTLRKGRS